MDEATTRVTVDKQEPDYWRVTLNHPPINTIDDLMYDEAFDLVQAIEAEPGLKVVTFESADPDYFLAHYGVGESQSRFGAPRWRDAAIQLAHSNVLSIAVIRGRARGGGTATSTATGSKQRPGKTFRSRRRRCTSAARATRCEWSTR
jgi:enoyl-CoA hydratase/carnithine racemase